ncbi:MAG: hypothetical protein QOH25_2779 [Acidobacteriota bacterium]|nr:hypothetical protein [Acidobacteriota bacterium]
MRGARAGLFVEFAHATMKNQDGRAGIARSDFNVLPGNAACPACLQGFERGFFGRKARGVMLRGDRSATVAVSALVQSINALDEARRAQHHFAHAMNFNEVYADGNNH